jgi:hypothetical protein
MEHAAGFHPSCEDCHAAAGERRQRAGHAACDGCHGESAAAAPRMTNCSGCHAEGSRAAAPARHWIRGDLRFSHSSHERDRVGRAISCTPCHDGVSSARGNRDLAPPEILRCTQCHADPRQAPPEVAMTRCTVCHLAATADAIAPRSHQLGALEPDDHTLAFRHDHADAARSAGARCALCHAGMSGSSRDACQECHAVMRPRDHTVTWRQDEHGREAASDRARCVACHAADYCESCHRIPPRSHLPRAAWTIGHAQVARFDLRSCFGCHTFEAGCTGAGCHARGLR